MPNIAVGQHELERLRVLPRGSEVGQYLPWWRSRHTPLSGDYSLAKRELGWEPRTSFENLIRLMVDADLQRFK